ncbi:hypothetical protein KC19_11G116100 [Ceratodon purpureus]|uniref:Protein kinase domain-containing protein n=1 Tax=Ceratodon purpureus TaxID=3225 RepID=A0A8T0GCY9_CERPU|nr:hypothetical protein KC19_11G116100 [Ceratodon purpureus]
MLSVAPGRSLSFSVLGTIIRVWRALAERTRGLTDAYPSLSWRSEPDIQTAQECLKRTVSVINRIEKQTSSLHFNHSLCELFVSNYLCRARDLLEERKSEIEAYSEQCAPTLTALFSTVKEAEFLIQKHCARSNWIVAAVELFENTSAFAEVILDLKWYIYALKIAIEFASGITPRQSKDKVWHLQSLAMAEYANFLESWESECQQLGLHKDREVLLSKLKIGSGDRIAEIRSLGLYLAQKLSPQDQSTHVREALYVDINASELLQNKVMLGEGAFGKVYQVEWLGMQCAVKQIGGKTAIDEEVKILSKLHHPNIIQLYGYSLDHGTLYLIMELMEETLGEYIEKKQPANLQKSPLSLDVALDCMLQIAKGMRYLHSRGMAHRDLKGGNVLVKPSENPELRNRGYLSLKLTDFGMAKANLRYTTFTPQSMNVGTLVWKAPELFRLFHSDFSNSGQLRQRNYYPFKADVYSFGMVCYEILCGKRPFSNVPFVSTSSFYAKVKRGERPELPDDLVQLPGLSEYIKRCWDTDPCRRPDFVDICKRIRHFRDSLLQVTAYNGWELKVHESTRVVEEPSTIGENDFIDADDWNWEIDYKDVVRGDRAIAGGSGFASVWPAWWKNSEQVLAKYIEVTLIDNDASIAHFKREVGLLVRMQHPNLVHYIGATSKAPFVVFTELAKGMIFLRKFLEKNSTPSHPNAVYIALQVALGMASLHEEEVTVIHGELSPDCILIDAVSLTARVADFGLRSFRNLPHKWQPRYFRAAPEQHQADTLHTSVDVFSFGMILYDLFEHDKAHHFWKKKNSADILRRGGRPTLDTASSYPSGMKNLIERCWAQDSEKRPSFGSIVADLQRMSTKLSRSNQSRLSGSSSSSGSHSRNRRRRG